MTKQRGPKAQTAAPEPDQGDVLVAGILDPDEPTITAEPRVDIEMDIEAIREKALEIDPATANYFDDIVLEADKIKPIDGATEDERKIAEVFSDLSPKQREAVMRKYRARVTRHITTENPLFIDLVYAKKVAPQWHFRWIAPRGIKRFGMRGYRPVVRTAKMLKIVPNCRQIGTNRYIEHADNVLCALPMTEYLHRQATEWRDANQVVTEMSEHHKSAWRAVASKIGLSSRDAERLDREGTGLYIARVPDPESPEQADLVSAEDEELVLE
jgi:hypothetical protein